MASYTHLVGVMEKFLLTPIKAVVGIEIASAQARRRSLKIIERSLSRCRILKAEDSNPTSKDENAERERLRLQGSKRFT